MSNEESKCKDALSNETNKDNNSIMKNENNHESNEKLIYSFVKDDKNNISQDKIEKHEEFIIENKALIPPIEPTGKKIPLLTGNLLKENQQDVIITDAKIEEIKQLPIDKEDTNNVISPESKEDEKNKLSIGNNIDENTKIINIEENAELFIENREDEYNKLLVEEKIESNNKDLYESKEKIKNVNIRDSNEIERKPSIENNSLMSKNKVGVSKENEINFKRKIALKYTQKKKSCGDNKLMLYTFEIKAIKIQSLYKSRYIKENYKLAKKHKSERKLILKSFYKLNTNERTIAKIYISRKNTIEFIYITTKTKEVIYKWEGNCNNALNPFIVKKSWQYMLTECKGVPEEDSKELIKRIDFQYYENIKFHIEDIIKEDITHPIVIEIPKINTEIKEDIKELSVIKEVIPISESKEQLNEKENINEENPSSIDNKSETLKNPFISILEPDENKPSSGINPFLDLEENNLPVNIDEEKKLLAPKRESSDESVRRLISSIGPKNESEEFKINLFTEDQTITKEVHATFKEIQDKFVAEGNKIIDDQKLTEPAHENDGLLLKPQAKLELTSILEESVIDNIGDRSILEINNKQITENHQDELNLDKSEESNRMQSSKNVSEVIIQSENKEKLPKVKDTYNIEEAVANIFQKRIPQCVRAKLKPRLYSAMKLQRWYRFILSRDRLNFNPKNKYKILRRQNINLLVDPYRKSKRIPTYLSMRLLYCQRLRDEVIEIIPIDCHLNRILPANFVIDKGIDMKTLSKLKYKVKYITK